MSDHLIAEASRHAKALTDERNNLVVEMNLLREWQREVIQNAKAHHAERKDAIARAERAEAELATERARMEKIETALKDAISTAQDRNVSYRLERDKAEAEYQRACEVEQELRAEVKRMTHAYEYDHKCLYEVRDRCHLWKQRAEKAEADLAKYLSACPASPTEEERKRCQQWWAISGKSQ